MGSEKDGILITTLTAILILLIFVCIRVAGARPASVYDELTVGFIYVGDESTPYTANFMRATEDLREKYGDKVRILERFNVSDEDPAPVINELVRERCNIIFANSYGYGETMKEMAALYPNVQFCQATCEDANQEPVLKNYHNFMGEIYEGVYVTGCVAGRKLQEMINEGTIGEDEALHRVLLKKSPRGVSTADTHGVLHRGLHALQTVPIDQEQAPRLVRPGAGAAGRDAVKRHAVDRVADKVVIPLAEQLRDQSEIQFHGCVASLSEIVRCKCG